MAKKWKPIRRGDLVTRRVGGEEIWYFDDYVQFDRFAPPKRVRKSTGCVRADYERAKDVRDQIRQKLREGDEALRRALTFDEWLPLWRAQYQREHPIHEDTMKRQEQAIGYLSAFFGPKRLDQIIDGDCIMFRKWRAAQPRLDSLRRPLPPPLTSPNTVITDCRIASAIWKCAVRAGKITKNPWSGLRLGVVGSRQRVLSEEEQALIVQHAAPQTMRFITITLGTSFRVGVLLDLPLDPLTYLQARDGRVISVIRMMSKGKIHTQPILPAVLQAISEQAAHVKQQNPRATKLFPYCHATILSWLQTLAKDANIPKFTPHDLRRTFGSRSSSVLAIDDTALLLNNTPAVAARHYVKVSDAADAARKLRVLCAMAPALLLPAVDTGADTQEDSAVQVVEE